MLHHSTLQAPEAEKIFGDHRNPREAHGSLTRPRFEGRAHWQGRRPPPCPRHRNPKLSIRFSSPAVEVILRAFRFPSSHIIWNRAGGFHPLTRRTHPSSHTKDSVPQTHSLFPWQICCTDLGTSLLPFRCSTSHLGSFVSDRLSPLAWLIARCLCSCTRSKFFIIGEI